MNKETRINKIAEILEQRPTGSEKIVWKDKLETMPVYEVPLEYLVYNKYNGRILSRTKSLEAQGVYIDPETETGKNTIAQLLWESKEDRNERTKQDLKKYGQKKVGIITRDGIIIDGNRRAMLLNQIDKFDYFRAIVLDVSSDQDPIEIEKLEASYQMGEDEKLAYNPIEVYLKTMELYKKLSGQSFYDKSKEDVSAIKKIYEWIGDYKSDEGEKGVRFRLQVMNTMNEYLDTLEYNNMYTALDGREEQFRGLTRWLSIFYNGSAKAFDGCKDIDVDDLKLVSFDLIRAKCRNTDFRYLAGGKEKKNHIFGNKNVWNSFLDNHNKLVESYAEQGINFDVPNLIKALDSRDAKFISDLGSKLTKNLTEHYGKIKNQLEKDKPFELSRKAFDAVDAIDRRSQNISKPEVLKSLSQVRNLVTEILQDVSVEQNLKYILDILDSIKLSEVKNKEEVCGYLTEINSAAYSLKKDL